MKIILSVIITLLITHAATAKEFSYPASQVFVLGTNHLSGINDEYSLDILNNLLDKLEAYQPDLIAIEALPPVETQSMAALMKEHGRVLKSYGRFQTRYSIEAQNALSKSWSDAMAEVTMSVPRCGSHEERQNCVLLYLASYDYYTALLLWDKGDKAFKSKFAKNFRRIHEGFSRRITSSNEYISIAIALAKRLDLERLYPVDSHSEKGPLGRHFEQPKKEADANKAMSGVSQDHPFIISMKKNWKDAADSGDVLPYYQFVNSPEAMQSDLEFQWTPWLANDGKSRIGNTRVAFWEFRNLNMAAHITRVMADNPGKKMVYIVGSSHKYYVEKYLKQMRVIEVVDAEKVLGKYQSQ
ncbi:hypothetical protein FLL45_14900 [Aliikangiella marina]|uniref:TraB/GumN family protein n=1 Tax=Aliikangiella marina TaxID=1712262 RepID=A0A545T6A8_9GAMM|nr:DUF5694 domain-containing protein [Aliikangiella marina]TQV72759.1 hypothetical protein FLL45_14900 [Aliikangiella marina]